MNTDHVTLDATDFAVANIKPEVPADVIAMVHARYIGSPLLLISSRLGVLKLEVDACSWAQTMAWKRTNMGYRGSKEATSVSAERGAL